MDIQVAGRFALKQLGKLNVLLGKNGSGKSRILKLAEVCARDSSNFGEIRYLSPERGGHLKYKVNIEQAMSNDAAWLPNARRQNQADNFREQSTTLFRQLELAVLRTIEREHQKKDYAAKSFDATVDLINGLLDRVEIVRDVRTPFQILDKATKQPAQPEDLSSGETELISLGIEILAFSEQARDGISNLLLMDEPDVHLHPDLQEKLAGFIIEALKDKPITMIAATHSTAFLAGLAKGKDSKVGFIRTAQTDVTFQSISDVDQKILPIFGAHPLSSVFNESAPLLVEGEDDERIWQQAIRSSGGRIRVQPCVVDGLPRFAEYEAETSKIIGAVYDKARAFSVRDRDTQPEHINDLPPLVRMRLACRSAENLMLSDDVLAKAGTSWDQLKLRITAWVSANGTHPYHGDLKLFVDGGFDRQNFDLKTIRNILVGLFSNKPWEVLVGQAISDLVVSKAPAMSGSLRTYLGSKICEKILNL